MKLRRIQAIALGIILLLLCMTGCGRKSEDAIQQSDIEQYVSAELPEESSADRLVDGSAGDSLDANAGEPEVESVSKPYSEMTTAEKIKTLTVEGCPLPIPCKVEDMGDGFKLRDGVTVENKTTCELVYEEKELGYASMSESLVDTDHLTDMSTGYEDALIDSINLSVMIYSVNFEIAGVTSDSTMEEVIEFWGEPVARKENSLAFYDTNEETGEEIAIIELFFFEDHLMDVYLHLKTQ